MAECLRSREARFLRTTRRTAATLRAQGYEVIFEEFAAGHSSDHYETTLIDRLQRIF